MQENTLLEPASPDHRQILAQIDYFRYHVERGGFAQLIFNLRGERLDEIELMLIRTGADAAHRYYEKAVRACLADETAYHQFVNGNFTDDNALKHGLQLLSLAYFAERIPFDQEVAKWLVDTAQVPK